MSYTIESVNGCTKKIIFNYDEVDLTKQIQEALVQKQKTVNLKGFRKGKAPLEMVKQLYGPQVENDALYRFVSEKFYDTLQKEDIKAIGYPSFGNTQYESGKSVAFEATVEVLPEFEIKDYSSYSFKKDSAEVKDEDVKAVKDQYLASKAEIVEVEDESKPLENAEFAVINFEGTRANGEKPENMKASEFMLEIGSGQFIPGFEEQLIGAKKGDKKDIKVTFPDTYHEEDLRNEEVTFAVDILEIKTKKLPEFDDQIAKDLGFESAEDFETKNRERLVEQKKREVQSKLQQEILEKLIEDNKFDVPSSLIEDQKKSVRSEISQTLKQQGFNEEMMDMYFDRWQEDITKKAEFQVRSGLILDKLAKKYSVEASEADLDSKIEEMVAQSQMKKEDILNFYKSNENVKKNMMYAIREEKTFEKLISEMKVNS